MKLTGIGTENIAAFKPLMPGLDYTDFALCVGAIEGGEPAGVALYSELGDSLFLDHIYVREKFRNMGIGKALILDTLQELSGADLVALHVNYPEKAADIHSLIESCGFRIFRDGTAYRTKISDYLASETASRLLGGSLKHRIIKVADFTRQQKNIIKQALDKNKLDINIIDDKSLSGRLSFATFDPKTNSPAGLLLCHENNETVVLSYLANFSNNPVHLLDILKALKAAILAEKMEDRELLFVTMTDDMAKLPEKLLETKELLHNEGPVVSGIKMLQGPWD